MSPRGPGLLEYESRSLNIRGWVPWIKSTEPPVPAVLRRHPMSFLHTRRNWRLGPCIRASLPLIALEPDLRWNNAAIVAVAEALEPKIKYFLGQAQLPQDGASTAAQCGRLLL